MGRGFDAQCWVIVRVILHGRGHGALVSHSTDVGCISEENTREETTSNRNYCATDGNIGISAVEYRGRRRHGRRHDRGI
jgi:hypothetical protein